MARENLPVHAVFWRAARHAILAAEPHKNSEAAFEYLGKGTMLEQTVADFATDTGGRIWTVTNAEQSLAVSKQLPQASRNA